MVRSIACIEKASPQALVKNLNCIHLSNSLDLLFALFNLVHEMDVKGKKIGILGDMRELGERTQKEHEKAGIEAEQ